MSSQSRRKFNREREQAHLRDKEAEALRREARLKGFKTFDLGDMTAVVLGRPLRKDTAEGQIDPRNRRQRRAARGR